MLSVMKRGGPKGTNIFQFQNERHVQTLSKIWQCCFSSIFDQFYSGFTEPRIDKKIETLSFLNPFSCRDASFKISSCLFSFAWPQPKNQAINQLRPAKKIRLFIANNNQSSFFSKIGMLFPNFFPMGQNPIKHDKLALNCLLRKRIS